MNLMNKDRPAYALEFGLGQWSNQSSFPSRCGASSPICASTTSTSFCLYNLQQDLIAYNHLLHGSVNSWEQIGALGLQGIGSNCMYAMGMLVGAYIIRFVPEVASWLIRAVSAPVQVQQPAVP